MKIKMKADWNIHPTIATTLSANKQRFYLYAYAPRAVDGINKTGPEYLFELGHEREFNCVIRIFGIGDRRGDLTWETREKAFVQ